MPLDEDGFLGEAAEVARRRLRNDFSEYFEMTDSANRVSETTVFTVWNRDGRQMTGAALLSKLQADVQAVLLSAERGLTGPAVAMLRVAFEALVLLTLVAEDRTFWARYLESHSPFRLKSLQSTASRRTGARLSDDELAEIRRVLSEVGQEMKASESPRLPDIADLVADADRLVAARLGVPRLSDEQALTPKYLTLYQFGSQEVHSTPAAIRSYWLGREDEPPTGFHHGPRTDDLPLIAVTATGILLAALGLATRLFDDVSIPAEVRLVAAMHEDLGMRLEDTSEPPRTP